MIRRLITIGITIVAIAVFLIARYGVLQDPGFLPEKCTIEGFDCVAYASDTSVIVELSSESDVDSLELSLTGERSSCTSTIDTLRAEESRTITLSGCELERRPTRFNVTLTYESNADARGSTGEIVVVG